MFTRTLAVFAALFLVSACEGPAKLEALQQSKPAATADDFQKALAVNYKTYAEKMASQDEWGVTRYFSEKGLDVIAGRQVEPEDPAVWKFGNPPMDELVELRTRLVKAVGLNRTTQPEIAASAVVAYDTLLVQHHSKDDASDIDAQKSVLEQLLTKLEEAHTATNPDSIPAPSVPSEANRTVLYFPYDSANLGDSALRALAELARSIPSTDDVSVDINGHADRAGTEAYNMKLSERRAVYVARELEKLGVAKKRLYHYAFGETDPAVATEDGVAEPKNRRVEVTVEQK